MIEFIDVVSDPPYLDFKDLYQRAIDNEQNAIEAFAISSYDLNENEVESRFVNLKYIQQNQWIFFSNYLSPKAKQFQSHNQISAVVFWDSINVQIRIKGIIRKTTDEISNMYFEKRSLEKNALAISSKQSDPIQSFEEVSKNFQITFDSISSSTTRPDYWGGFAFIPYYFEFWEGQENRLNKRHAYHLQNNSWIETILQP